MKRTFIKLGIIMAFIACIVSVAGCQKPEPMPEIVTGETFPVEYEAKIYKIAEWKESGEAKSPYRITLLAYANEFHAEISEDDVQYLSKDGYAKLTDCFYQTDVQTYVMNQNSDKALCTYITIASEKLLDTNKIFIHVRGDDNSVDMFCGISSNTPVYADIEAVYTNTEDYGAIRVDTEGYPFYIYEKISASNTNDSIWTEYKLIPLNNASFSEFKDTLILDGKFYRENGDMPIERSVHDYSEVQLIDSCELICDASESGMRIGLKTKDGTSIDSYRDALPNVFGYQGRGAIAYFCIIGPDPQPRV